MAGQFLGPGGLGRGELRRRSAGDYRHFEFSEGEGLRAPQIGMKTMGFAMGPGGVLHSRIAALSAPPTAASGFQAGGLSRLEGCLGVIREDDSSAAEFMQERYANGRGCRPLGGFGVGDLFCLCRCCRSCNLALGLWHLVTGQLERLPQPEAIVFEARQSKTVFLFTKRQGQWTAQSLPMNKWAKSCEFLKDSNNWYPVDAFEASNPIMLAAKTVIACSPARNHYSDFLKGAGECVFVEAFRWAEVEVCHPWRFQQVGGALRTLLASQTGYEQAVELQRAEAKEFSTVERAFAGELNNVDGKTMPTRLFTYRSADGISKKVSVCSPGAAALLVEKHYDKLVQLWCDPSTARSRYGSRTL